MSRYILIRRLMGPAILLLIGVLALLHQAGVTRFWPLFWPLLLILVGIIKLAERAALASEGYPPYPGAPYAAYPNQPGVPVDANQPANPGTAMVPANDDLNVHGGQS